MNAMTDEKRIWSRLSIDVPGPWNILRHCDSLPRLFESWGAVDLALPDASG